MPTLGLSSIQAILKRLHRLHQLCKAGVFHEARIRADKSNFLDVSLLRSHNACSAEWPHDIPSLYPDIDKTKPSEEPTPTCPPDNTPSTDNDCNTDQPNIPQIPEQDPCIPENKPSDENSQDTACNDSKIKDTGGISPEDTQATTPQLNPDPNEDPVEPDHDNQTPETKSQNKPITADEVRKILSESKDLKELNKTIEKLKEKTSDRRYGKYEDKMTHLSIQEFEKKLFELEKLAEETYEKIRSISSDVDRISKNTGIDKKIIQAIKDHLFNETHTVKDQKGKTSIKKFDANPDIANAWKRLADGDFVQSDLKLLQHELAESIIMKETINNYDPVHYIVQGIYNWEESL